MCNAKTQLETQTQTTTAKLNKKKRKANKNKQIDSTGNWQLVTRRIREPFKQIHKPYSNNIKGKTESYFSLMFVRAARLHQRAYCNHHGISCNPNHITVFALHWDSGNAFR